MPWSTAARRLHPRLLDQRLANSLAADRRSTTASGQLRACGSGGGSALSRTGAERTSPVPMRSSGMLPTPAAANARAAPRRSAVDPTTMIWPASTRRSPVSTSASSDWPLPGHAGDAEDLALAHVEVDVVQRRQAA